MYEFFLENKTLKLCNTADFLKPTEDGDSINRNLRWRDYDKVTPYCTFNWTYVKLILLCYMLTTKYFAACLAV